MIFRNINRECLIVLDWNFVALKMNRRAFRGTYPCPKSYVRSSNGMKSVTAVAVRSKFARVEEAARDGGGKRVGAKDAREDERDTRERGQWGTKGERKPRATTPAQNECRPVY